MNYRISIIYFINLNNFLKFLEKVKSDGYEPGRKPRDNSPVSYYEPGPKPPPLLPVAGPRAPPFVPVGVLTGTTIRPDWIVPVGEPGPMAQTNRDNRLFFY